METYTAARGGSYKGSTPLAAGHSDEQAATRRSVRPGRPFLPVTGIFWILPRFAQCEELSERPILCATGSITLHRMGHPAFWNQIAFGTSLSVGRLKDWGECPYWAYGWLSIYGVSLFEI